MLSPTITHLKSQFVPERRQVPIAEPTRRTTHGGVAWIKSAPRADLYQPQDGAIRMTSAENDPSGRITDIVSRLRRPILGEPEDARITGGTRSLKRRVSGLNLRTARSAMSTQVA